MAGFYVYLHSSQMIKRTKRQNNGQLRRHSQNCDSDISQVKQSAWEGIKQEHWIKVSRRSLLMSSVIDVVHQSYYLVTNKGHFVTSLKSSREIRAYF